MTNSFVLLDNSGSMARYRYPIGWFDPVKFLAEAFLSAASPSNQVGLISFASRVKVERYCSPNPTDLVVALDHVPPPSGTTELVDAMFVSLTVDVPRIDNLFIITDKGENTSEFSMASLQAVIKANNQNPAIYWIIPPLPRVFRPLPKFLATPPGVKVLKELGAKVLDFSKLTDDAKFVEVLDKIHDGRIRELL